MTWKEVADIINQRMTTNELSKFARVDIPSENGVWTTEKCIQLVKDTFGIWTFVVGDCGEGED
jgi:hypothetical protein